VLDGTLGVDAAIEALLTRPLKAEEDCVIARRAQHVEAISARHACSAEIASLRSQ
jgi:hypothetical protein